MEQQQSSPSTPLRRFTRSSHQQSDNARDMETDPGQKPKLALSPEALQSHLCKRFPGRHAQIRQLLSLLGGPGDYIPTPLLIYGGPACGKTSIVREAFSRMGRPYAFASCRSCFSPRLLFESVLNQLLSHCRSRANGYRSAKKCERLSDFVGFLKEAVEAANARKRKGSKGLEEFKNISLHSAAGEGEEDSAEVVYLVFDNIDLVLEWSNGFGLVSALFKLCDLTRMPNLGLVFISDSSPDAFYSHTGMVEPLSVYFPDYTDDELRQILLRGCSNPELYGSFLNACLKPFSRASRRVTELSAALEPLLRKYCEYAGKESAVPDEKEKRRLFASIEPHIAPSLNQIFHVATFGSNASDSDKVRKKAGAKRQLMDDVLDDLDFHLSICGKYLLISAFIASRNPATLDAVLFDSTGEADGRKRKRKNVLANEKKEMEAEEKLLKGPGNFPLERLLAIFQCITAVGDEELDNSQSDGALGSEDGNGLMADALMQLSTLCKINLLHRGSSCLLEGACRYRCNIDEELAMKIARNVNFPLSKYLYR